MRHLAALTLLLVASVLYAQKPDPRFSINDSGELAFGGGLKLAKLLPEGEWRYFGVQEQAGRELLRFSFVVGGLREVTVDLSYSEKPSSGSFEKKRLNGFVTGFSLKEGLSKGKEEKNEMTIAGASATRISRILSDKKRTFHFVAYLISRNPYTVIWIVSGNSERVSSYQLEIEKL